MARSRLSIQHEVYWSRIAAPPSTTLFLFICVIAGKNVYIIIYICVVKQVIVIMNCALYYQYIDECV